MWFVSRWHYECHPVGCRVACTSNGGFCGTDNARCRDSLRWKSACAWPICLQLPHPLLQLLLFVPSPTLRSKSLGYWAPADISCPLQYTWLAHQWRVSQNLNCFSNDEQQLQQTTSVTKCLWTWSTTWTNFTNKRWEPVLEFLWLLFCWFWVDYNLGVEEEWVVLDELFTFLFVNYWFYYSESAKFKSL